MLNTNDRAFCPIHTSVNGQQQCLSVYDYTILSGDGLTLETSASLISLRWTVSPNQLI